MASFKQDGIQFTSVLPGQKLPNKYGNGNNVDFADAATDGVEPFINAVEIDWNGVTGVFGFDNQNPLKTTGQLLNALSRESVLRARIIAFNTSRASKVNVKDAVHNDTVSGYAITEGTTSILYLPEYPTWSTLTGKPSTFAPSIGTTATTAAAGNHTHTASLATDTGISSITLASAGKYKLTAGGSSVIFTMPTIPAAATWSNLSGKPNFATVATSGSYNDLTNRPTILTIGTTANTAAAGNHTHTWTAASGGPSANATLTHGGTFTVPQVSQAANGQVTVTNRTMTMPAATGHTTGSATKTYSATANGAQYIESIKVDQYGHVIEVIYGPKTVTTPVISLNPSSDTTITDAKTVSATVTNGTASNTTWGITNEGTTGNTFKKSAASGASITVTPNNTTTPTANKGTVSISIGSTNSTSTQGTRVLNGSFTQGAIAKNEYATTVTASYSGATPKSVKLTYSKSTSPLSAGTYTWSVVSGKSLPSGVSLSATTGQSITLINTNTTAATVAAGTIQLTNTNASNTAVYTTGTITVPAKTTPTTTNKWFKGDTNPATLTSVGQTKTTWDTWTTATSITNTKVILEDEDLNDHTWYFAFPQSWNVTTMYDSLNTNPVPTTQYTITNNVSIGGSPFTVFKMNTADSAITAYFR